jgi:hypothetical protein
MKLIYQILFISAFSINVYSQNFTFIPASNSLSDTLGAEVIFDFTITNTSSSDIIIYINRRLNDLPEGWQSSLCFDQGCFAPFVDSVVTNKDFQSSAIPPGMSRPFSIHINLLENTGTGFVTVTAADFNNPSDSVTVQVSASTVSVSVKDEFTPAGFYLNHSYPNPFNPSTTIEFGIDKRNFVSLKVYDILGNVVAELFNEEMERGNYKILFNASFLSSGIYFVKLSSGNFVLTRKILLEK